MTGPRGRRTHRLRSGRIARVVLTATLAALPTLVAALPGGSPTPAAAQGGAGPIQVSLSSITPIAPQPGDTLAIAGTLSNTSAEEVDNLTVQLEYGTSALIGRGTFDSYAADPSGDLASNPTPMQVASSSTVSLHDLTLGAGDSEPFTLSVPIDSLYLGDFWQVRELALVATGEADFVTATVGQLRTFLPYAPRDAAIGRDRLNLAWLWPLVDRPHRGVSPTWLDNGLAPELANGGRLNSLVDAALKAGQLRGAKKHTTLQDVPVTFAIDPMLLDDVNTMRSAYQVATGDPKKPAAGTGQADATTFLSDLRTATTQGNVIALPYGDPDIAADVRSGLSTLLGLAITGGNSIMSRLLTSATIVNTAWPPGGLLDQRSVDALIGNGTVDSLLLSDQALPLPEEPSATPSAHASLSTDAGTLDAVLSDSELSAAVNAGAQPGADSVLATQRTLAETLMIEAELPSIQRYIVIAPARRWAPSAAYADALLADTGKVPWLHPVTVSQVLASPVEAAVERAPLTYPGSAKRAELSPSYMDDIASLQQTIADVSSILPASDRSTLPYTAALLRATSSAWRNDPVTRGQQYDAIKSAVEQALGSVHIASRPGSRITLTSHGGQFPVTIANDLDVPVNVTVELEPTPRLTFAHGGREQRTIPPHQRLAVDFRATAKTSGVFPIKVHLLTPEGRPYGRVIQLFVRSTVYGTITLVITAAAAGLLLLAAAVRLTRRALASRRTAAAT